MHTRTHNDAFVVRPLLLFVLTTFLISSMCVLSFSSSFSSSLVFPLFFIICPLFFVLFSLLFFLISLSFLFSFNCLFSCPFSFLSSVPFWLLSSLPVSSNLCDLVDLFSSFSSPLLSPPPSPPLSPSLFLLSLLQYTLMAVYVWIFYRTDGVQHMTYHQY